MDKHHADRDHATWSASSTDRNWNCPGALALSEGLPETTSEAADWGTVCHEISEISLRKMTSPHALIGETRKGKEHEFEVDEEMADTAAVYVDYVIETVMGINREMSDLFGETTEPPGRLQIEQKFSLESLKPPFDAGGTGDAVIYDPINKLLEVVDLKGGRGVAVDVKGNPQLRTYALGAMLANPKLDVEKIKVTVIQPRVGDGKPKTETFSVVELHEWTTDLMAAMWRAKRAFTDRKKMPQATWEKTYLKPGAHCKFCKASGGCPAQERAALDAAGVWFDDLDQPRIDNAPDAMSAEKLASTLDSLDMIQDWINAVRAYAHRLAEDGVDIPGYQLVDKIGHRAWVGSDEEIAGFLKANGVADPYKHKLISPAQAEAALGKKKAVIEGKFEKPKKGTNLVSSSKTTRPAATPAVKKHLENLDAPPTVNLFD